MHPCSPPCLHCHAGALEQEAHQTVSAQHVMQEAQVVARQIAGSASTPASEAASGLLAGVPQADTGTVSSPAVAQTTAAVNKPKQTLEEMAAWLDAQLAAAPGKLPWALVLSCPIVCTGAHEL